MFLPQVPELDAYDANGNQIDDINSLAEYVAVAFGYDHTSDDEDDDYGQNIHLVNFDIYNFEQYQVQLEPVKEITNGKKVFPSVKQNIVIQPIIEIPFPPPEV